MALAPGLRHKPEPAAHRNARMVLQQHGITVTQIIRVNPDSILYAGIHDQAMTAWLAYNNGRLDIAYQPGFPAEPAAWVLRSLHREEPNPDEQDQA